MEDKDVFIGSGGWFGLHVVDAGTVTSNPTVLSLGEWHHIAMVYDSVELRAYLDGVEVGNAPRTGVTKNWHASAYIGAIYRDGRLARPIDGMLDEFRISYTARYTGDSFDVPFGPFVSDAQTAMLLHFDEGTGTQVFDGSSSGNIGTFGAGAQAPQWVEGVSIPEPGTLILVGLGLASLARQIRRKGQ